MARSVTTLSTKGQVILPKVIRDKKQWSAGTRLIVENTPSGVLLREDLSVPVMRPEDVFGMLKYDGPPVSIEEMNEAIAIGVKERSARGRY
jgi:AbrB family looped-hinge helix DNA binding protein